MREMPSPQQEEPRDGTPTDPPKKSILKRLAENPLAKPLLVAGALHLPLQKDVGHAIEQAGHAAIEATKGAFERENTVVEAQNASQKNEVRARVADRESRVDKSARQAYKLEAEKKLEAGEQLSFKRMQFDLEKLNGVPADEVASAEKKADELIAKYSASVGADLDANKLKAMSMEMYGPDTAGNWGQASVSRYFNNGDRNCVAISRGQSIVLEGVLAHIPPEKRKHWRQTTQIVNQHEIAGVEHVDDAGKRDALYLLEGKLTRQWRGAEDEPGTANIPMDTVKKALVSEAPIGLKAAGNPAEVKSGPRFDFVSDEPASLNIKIEGKLKSSEFNVQEAKREGLEPRKMTEAEIAAQAEQEKKLEGQTIEFDVLRESTVADAKKRMEDGKQRGVGSADPETGELRIWVGAVDARDFAMPTKEAVATFGQSDGTTEAWKPRTIFYGPMTDWSDDAVRQALRNDIPTMTLQQEANGRLNKKFLIEYAQASKTGELKPTTVRIEVTKGDAHTDGNYIRPDDFSELLHGAAPTIDVSELDFGIKTDRSQNIDLLKHMPATKTVIMPKHSLSAYDKDLFEQLQGKIVLECNDYALLSGSLPEVLDNPHVQFDMTANTEDLDGLRTIVDGFKPGHPVIGRINAEIKKRQEAQPPQD